MSVAGVLYFRYTKPDAYRPIKVPLIVPIIFVVICAFLIVVPCYGKTFKFPKRSFYLNLNFSCSLRMRHGTVNNTSRCSILLSRSGQKRTIKVAPEQNGKNHFCFPKVIHGSQRRTRLGITRLNKIEPYNSFRLRISLKTAIENHYAISERVIFSEFRLKGEKMFKKAISFKKSTENELFILSILNSKEKFKDLTILHVQCS